jgi:hypothetical protein
MLGQASPIFHSMHGPAKLLLPAAFPQRNFRLRRV